MFLIILDPYGYDLYLKNYCYNILMNTKRNIFTQEIFINFAKLKYNEKFDYTKTNYKTYSRDKITIKCIEHNLLFDIYPYNHLRQISGGCVECEKNQKKKLILHENEIIKDIPILEYNNYCITNTGRCFSKKTNKELSKTIIGGYYVINLYNNEHNNKQFKIHYLTYITFNDDYDNNKVIDHIDGNKLNNNLINLRCVSQSENVINAYKNNKNMYQQNIIQAFDKQNILIREFNTIDEARIFIDHKNTSAISNCLRGGYKTSGGYIWKFKNEIITENKQNNYVNDITKYISVGIINNNDFSNYLINNEGDIINSKYNNRKIKSFINESNYKCIYLYYEDNKKSTFLLHRLLGKYFLENGNNYFNDSKYIINHKDKNKLNNNITNLEWITQKENTIHGRGRKISKIDIKTDEIIKIYTNITDAYIELNKPWNSLISKVCNGNYGRKTIYGFKWKYINE